eukprot:scaffold29715_cov71-Phaeocystis_antarctica.AAC.2
MYEKHPLLPMQPSGHGTRCRSLGTCVLKSRAAKGSNSNANPVQSASLGPPFSPHDDIGVGQTQDVDSPEDVERALCGAQGPSVRHGAAHVSVTTGGGARGGGGLPLPQSCGWVRSRRAPPGACNTCLASPRECQLRCRA